MWKKSEGTLWHRQRWSISPDQLRVFFCGYIDSVYRGPVILHSGTMIISLEPTYNVFVYVQWNKRFWTLLTWSHMLKTRIRKLPRCWPTTKSLSSHRRGIHDRHRRGPGGDSQMGKQMHHLETVRYEDFTFWHFVMPFWKKNQPGHFMWCIFHFSPVFPWFFNSTKFLQFPSISMVKVGAFFASLPVSIPKD